MRRTIFSWALACLAVGVLSTAMHAGLVAHLALDGDLTDSSGSGNDGSVVEGAVTYDAGYDGTASGAAVFDGGTVVSLAQTTSLPLYNNASFSVAMWVKGIVQPAADPDPAINSDKRLFSEGSTAGNNPLYNIGTHNSAATGGVDIYVRGDDGAAPVGHVKSSAIAYDGSWHHVVVVDDGGELTMYVDAVRTSPGISYTRPTLTLDTTTIGGILRASTCCQFTGMIDDVRLYDNALSQEDVDALVATPEDCEGDTTCDGLEIVGADGPVADGDTFKPGLFTATVNATDADGDPILYVIQAVNLDTGEEIYIGPQTANTAELALASEGAWTIGVAVADRLACRALASFCTLDFTTALEPPRLVAHWTLDGTLADATGEGNDGSTLGYWTQPYATGVDCAIRGAGRFAGSHLIRSASVSVPVYNLPAYSVAMWVKGPTNQRDIRVYSESNTAGNNTPLFNIGTDSTNPPAGLVDIFIRTDSGTPVSHVKSAGVAFDDTWHHIAWVDDDGAAKLYIDGVQDATDFTYAKTVMSSDTATVGGILRGSISYMFTGSIDDVRVWNYAVDEADIVALAATPPECEAELPQLGGDCNGDGSLSIADVICGINLLIPGFNLLNPGTAVPPCTEDLGLVLMLDSDGNGTPGLSDVVFMANYLFRGGLPPAMGEGCVDIPESLGCGTSPACE